MSSKCRVPLSASLAVLSTDGPLPQEELVALMSAETVLYFAFSPGSQGCPWEAEEMERRWGSWEKSGRALGFLGVCVHSSQNPGINSPEWVPSVFLV